MANSLTIEKIDAAYGAVRVLEDVSLKVNSGETVVLLGTNGNGKSTLMKCVMGIVRPRAGAIVVEIDGERFDLIGRSTEQIVDLGIALVPEGRRLFPRLTVEENLLLGAFRHKARAALKSNLDFCFECFPRLAERRAQLAGSLSGGEQQMLALARALMLAPRILLIDEPSVEETIEILNGLRDRYEAYHRVRISPEALVAAAELSDRYITDRFLPDKAIDLVDESASRLRMEIDSSPVELDEADRRVRQLEIELAAMAK